MSCMPHVDVTLDWTAGLRPPDAPRTHRTSVRGLVVDGDERILFVRTHDGHVMLPGGGIEDGEGDADCVRREIAEETGVVIDRVGEYLGTCTELNPDRDGFSTWELECRYWAATTTGDTVPATLVGYETELGLHPVWLTSGEAISLLTAQLDVRGRPRCWAMRELPVIAAWCCRA